MISLTLSPAEALAVHRALDREARMYGDGTAAHDLARAIAARLAPLLIAEAQAEPAEGKVVDHGGPGIGV